MPPLLARFRQSVPDQLPATGIAFRDVHSPNLPVPTLTPTLPHHKAEKSTFHQHVLSCNPKLKAVVTQNIDGLHQAAGSKRVLELHGNWTRLECTGCGARSTIDDFDEARAGRVPHCPSCSAVVRPDIVFYGEALDPATLEGAVLAIAGADMLIVGGTSLAVYPAAGLIDYYQGGRLVLMNATPTPYDGRADLIIRESIGRVFAQIQGHV